MRLNSNEIIAGQLLEASAEAYTPDGDELSYRWEIPEGAVVRGEGADVLIETDLLKPGEYAITALVTNGIEAPFECLKAPFRVIDPDSP